MNNLKKMEARGHITSSFHQRVDYIFILLRMLDSLACTQVVSAPSSHEARLSIAMQLNIV